MNNSGYFTSRNEIIEWINDLLITHLTKIEQLGSGNIYCQLLDAAFPEKVPLSKVKWQAYLQIDFLHNFKILQTSLDRLGINKHIDIQKLAKAKYQDNLQFVQWMRWYLSPRIKENRVYNALSRRSNQQINLLFAQKKNFDLRQTVVLKEQDKQQQRQLREIKQNNMISSITSQYLQPTLKTYKSSLGLTLGLTSNQKTSTVKISANSKLQGKQNVKTAPKGWGNKQTTKSTTKLRPEINTKPKVLFQKVVIKAVEVIQSDDEQCF